MNLANRSLVTIDDLSNGEIEALFSLADEMADSPKDQAGVCHGKIMASLFFEPSTRTRLSFEAAMLRLGGRVISALDPDHQWIFNSLSFASKGKNTPYDGYQFKGKVMATIANGRIVYIDDSLLSSTLSLEGRGLR